MRTQQTLTRIAVSSYIPTLAALALALALIFSCSSGGNDEQGSKPPETGSSDEETQVSSSSNIGTTESSSSFEDGYSSGGGEAYSYGEEYGISSSSSSEDNDVEDSSSSLNEGSFSSSSFITMSSNSKSSSSSSVNGILCGTSNRYYNPETQFCEGNSIANKCSGEIYDTATQRCRSNVIETKCGTGSNYHNPAIEQCCANNKYTIETQFCEGNNVVDKCDGDEYNTATQGCCNNAIFEYEQDKYACKNNVVVTKCGTGSNYHNPATQFCYGNSVFDKCSDKEYDIDANQRCRNGDIVNLSFGSLTDDRDNKTYKTVVIGTQTWMAENLNYATSGSMCNRFEDPNCDIYGMYYDWATAMGFDSDCNSNSCSSLIETKHQGICPDGWHIPNYAEWDTLLRYIDGNSGTSSSYTSLTAAKYLKSVSGWDDGGYGQDTYGFAALHGGFGSIGIVNGNVIAILGWSNNGADWWTVAELRSDVAYTRSMLTSYDHVGIEGYDKRYVLNIRCVKD